MASKPLETLLTYDKLIKYIEEWGYDKIADGEFIAYTIPEIAEESILVVRRGEKYKESIDKIKKELTSGKVEGSIKTYGILFVDKYVVFLRFNYNKCKVDALRKSLDKISPAFKKKIRRFLNKIKELGKLDPDDEKRIYEWNSIWDELFDRSDLIEEFYRLYIKARENLINNVGGILDDPEKEEFADNLLMQLLIIWYLQEEGFFNKDPRYLITKFKEYKKLGFKSYYEFLKELFEKMMSEPNDGIYYKDHIFGKIVVTGSAPFLNGKFHKVQIPDRVFYIEGKTEDLKKMEPKNLSPSDVPILNLFESREWTEGNIDAFVLGAIFEKMMTSKERKEKGAYYTPEKITRYICDNAIKSYLIDIINEKFGTKYTSLEEFFNKSFSEEHYRFLFDALQKIKILDPACGSGHFLESAIELLVEIYERIREKAKEYNFNPQNFRIITVDDRGNIRKEPLLDINDKDLRVLKLKFHIIISRNIYGVDILPSAIKIARARLFLSLAKHFDPNRKIHIRFPNVHFNLRIGNSLIGLASLNKEVLSKLFGQVTLDQFLSTEDGSSSIEIKVDPDLQDYLKKMDSILDTNTISLISEFKRHCGAALTREVFSKALKLRGDLIKILLVSLNTKYAVKLKSLIEELTEAFNKRLNSAYVSYLRRKGIRINEGTLEKDVGFFHWVMEFSEVFSDNGGFDIVVGNPPYVRQERIDDLTKEANYKELLMTLYRPSENTFDLSMYFILRSLRLLKEKGYHSFIITNKWLRAKYGKTIRKYLKENVTIKRVIDFNGVKVFVGPTVDTIIYVIKKEKPNEDNEIFYNNPKSLEDIEKGGYYVKQSNLEDEVWNFVDERTLKIKKWVEKVGVPLKELDVKIYRGITTGFNEAFIIDDETRRKLIEEDAKSEELIKPLLRGRDIGRYYVEWDRKWIIVIPAGFTKRLFKKDLPLKDAEELFKKEYPSIYKHFEPFKYKKGKGKGLVDRDDQGDYWWELRPCDYYDEFKKPKIMWQEISVNSIFSWDLGIFYIPNNAYIMTNASKTYLMILNSKLIEEIFKQISQFLSNGYRHTKQYIEKIPIRLPNNTEPYEILVDYLLFLNAKEDWREKYREIINFFDKEIADSLIYELYFKEKLYNEDKEYLLEAVSEHLKPINYDRWAELYWKKQLEGNLTKEKEEELKLLEEEDLKVIKEVYEALKNDEEIYKLIEKIKSHKWVKIIEKH